MSLYAKAVAAKGTDAPVDEVLAGNLCRCTGYGPIIAAPRPSRPRPRRTWPRTGGAERDGR
jgi:xanthine dehydrogenase small subunit